MNLTNRKISAVVSLLVVTAIGQAYIGVSLAGTTSGSATSEPAVQQVMGILSTSDNKPITVNGASARGGATIPSGSTIETPAGVGATIKLGPLGTLCVAPSTRLTLVFDGQGNVVNVLLAEGCAILRTPKNVSGAINSPQGAIGTIDPASGGSLDVCMKAGAAPSVNQGAAADAGAGASLADCAAGAAALPPTGIPPAVTAAFIGGGAVGLYLLFRGGNPSPSGP